MFRRAHPHEHRRVVVGLVAASAVAFGLVLLREVTYEASDFRFLAWNLVLAWTPLLVALLVYHRYGRGTSLVLLSPVILIWLLFLPNAPYILTDFIHLSTARDVPVWFDGATLAAFALTGLLIGFTSLNLLHVVARHRLGSFAAWVCVALALGLVSTGVCLGRFLRWNSWDVFLNPGRLTELSQAANASALIRGTATVVLLTVLLSAAYIGFFALLGARLEPARLRTDERDPMSQAHETPAREQTLPEVYAEPGRATAPTAILRWAPALVLAAFVGFGTTTVPGSGQPGGSLAAPLTTISIGSEPADPIIAAAGDIACDPQSGSFNGGLGTPTECRQKYTSDLLLDGALFPQLAAALVLGDIQYEDGASAKFGPSYDPSWGRVKTVTRPVPGNHEYGTAAAAGYFQYFGAAAGDPSKGYYSYDLGAWHLIALNSNCAAVGGCGTGSPQEQWLKADLAAAASTCVLAYWHHPRFSSGEHGSDTAYDAFWRALFAAGADVVLTGHDHDYERFALQDPDQRPSSRGIRQFVVGTGGKSLRSFSAAQPNSEVRLAQSFGVLKVTLGATSYAWQFISEGDGSVLDAGSTACSPPSSSPPPPPAPPALIVSDQFERSVAAGLGTADAGGSWSVTSTQRTKVVGGDAVIYGWSGGSQEVSAWMPTAASDMELLGLVKLHTANPVGASYQLRLMARAQTDARNGYSARITHTTAGAATFGLARIDNAGGNGSLTLAAGTLLPSGAAGSQWWIRLRVEGTSIKAKYWRNGTAEPVGWTAQATDGYWASGRASLGAAVYAGMSSPFPEMHFASFEAVDLAGGPSPPPPPPAPPPPPPPPAPPALIVSDQFERSVAAGLGTADVGGSWSVSSTQRTKVQGGDAVIYGWSGGGQEAWASMPTVASDMELLSLVKLNATNPVGANYQLRLMGRAQTDARNGYSARITHTTAGAASFGLSRIDNAGGTGSLALSTGTLLPSGAAGTQWWIRLRAEGTSIKAKYWRNGTAEPAGWTAQATDGYWASGRASLGALVNAGTSSPFPEMHFASFEALDLG